MVFFQSALLAGYALAHLLIRRASPPGQLAVLAALWVGVALTVPVGGLRLLCTGRPVWEWKVKFFITIKLLYL